MFEACSILVPRAFVYKWFTRIARALVGRGRCARRDCTGASPGVRGGGCHDLTKCARPTAFWPGQASLDVNVRLAAQGVC